MAALKIAFEAPDNFGGACPSTARPIDLVHLATQTMGDKLLEIEVLQMFARQTRQLMKDLSSDSADVRLATAHRLRGAALAVGAFGVAEAAAVKLVVAAQDKEFFVRHDEDEKLRTVEQAHQDAKAIYEAAPVAGKKPGKSR